MESGPELLPVDGEELVELLEELAVDLLGTELEELCRNKWLLKVILETCEGGLCLHCRSHKH